MNPAVIMKIMSAKHKFEQTHPKFAQFLSDLIRNGVNAGDVIDINITRADGSRMSTNMRVQESDLELFDSLKDIGV